jgi:hypothetical protein
MVNRLQLHNQVDRVLAPRQQFTEYQQSGRRTLMTVTRRTFLAGVFCGAVAMSLLAGCAGQRDAISQAATAEKKLPGIAETRAIAEEGFI